MPLRSVSLCHVLLLVALVFITLGCQAFARDEGSAPAGHRGTIFYASPKGIWKVTLPCQETTQLLSPGPNAPDLLKVSPNGRWLAYVDIPYDVQERRRLRPQLWLLSTEGGTPLLLSASVNFQVYWWNDSRLLYFDFDAGRDPNPVVYDPETHTRRVAEEWNQFQCLAALNPVNAQEALENCGTRGQTEERGYLRVATLDGRPPITITEPFVDHDTQWSVDGRQVLFEDGPLGRGKLFIWNRQDDRLRQIIGQVSSQDYGLLNLVWSPDGKWIAAVGHVMDLCFIRVETGAVMCIPDAVSAIGALVAWSPDSNAVLIKTNRLSNWALWNPGPIWDLFIVDVPSMKDTRITDSSGSNIKIEYGAYAWAP